MSMKKYYPAIRSQVQLQTELLADLLHDMTDWATYYPTLIQAPGQVCTTPGHVSLAPVTSANTCELHLFIKCFDYGSRLLANPVGDCVTQLLISHGQAEQPAAKLQLTDQGLRADLVALVSCSWAD